MKETKTEKVQLVNQSKHCKVFNIVKRKNKYIITINMYVVSQNEFESLEEAENYIENKPWDLILNSLIAVNALEQVKNETNTNKN